MQHYEYIDLQNFIAQQDPNSHLPVQSKNPQQQIYPSQHRSNYPNTGGNSQMLSQIPEHLVPNIQVSSHYLRHPKTRQTHLKQ